jgi:serine/threonine-protein kinase HipA
MATPKADPVLPERIRTLSVSAGRKAAGELLKHSIYEFRYPAVGSATSAPEPPAISLLMPPRQPTWRSGDLFPVMDQILPEGDLYLRLRSLFPKQPLTPMHLLALIGDNGVGRLGFGLPEAFEPRVGTVVDRQSLLRRRWTPEVFDELVAAYLSTGAGIAGMQPKIMVPDRPTLPVPTLIVKAGSPAYPHLAANEYLCLSAARRAGLAVPGFELSDDAQLLVLDRFDIEPDGTRLGFEDMAALMGLRVRDVQSDRKYQGSYEAIVQLLRLLGLPASALAAFFEQLALSVMVRNGDAHLKNFGVLYGDGRDDARLSPLFDVVTTSIYRYQRWAGGPPLEDRTLALKLNVGRHASRSYPRTEELLHFGRRLCGVTKPAAVLDRIAQGMHETLAAAEGDARIPAELRSQLTAAWASGTSMALEAARR